MNVVRDMIATAAGGRVDGWGHMWGWGGGGMWLGGLIMMLFWLALIVAVVWLVARALAAGSGRARETGSSGMERARDILAERYARGEITSEEYRERLDRLV